MVSLTACVGCCCWCVLFAVWACSAEALASQVTDEERDKGLVYPPLHTIRSVSAHIARAVANKAFEMGAHSPFPSPDCPLPVPTSAPGSHSGLSAGAGIGLVLGTLQALGLARATAGAVG